MKFITILIALTTLAGACYGDRPHQVPGASYTRPIQKPGDHPVRKAKPVDHSRQEQRPPKIFVPTPHSRQEERSPQQIIDEEGALLAKMDRYGKYLDQQYLIWLRLPLGSAQYYAMYNDQKAGYARLRQMHAEFDELHSEFDRALARSRPSEPPPSHSVPLDPSRSPNDCAIIALQVYDRVKKSASWAQVIGFDLLINGEQRGHAAVVFKYQEDGPVFYYDAAGTLQLRTTGTGVSDIEAAVSDSCRYPVSGMRFLTL